MKVAVIGSGISGMSAAWFLSRDNEVHLYEADSRLGGHTATIDVNTTDESLAIDTGFIVFNDWTYPNFIALMNEIGVSSQPTNMSFSVSDRQSGLEYAGSGLDMIGNFFASSSISWIFAEAAINLFFIMIKQ